MNGGNMYARQLRGCWRGLEDAKTGSCLGSALDVPDDNTQGSQWCHKDSRCELQERHRRSCNSAVSAEL
jgi:hypothetical protein